MTLERPFKICIIISACAHLALMYPWPHIRLIRDPEISFKKIELAYWRDDPSDKVFIKELEPITSVGKPDKSGAGEDALEEDSASDGSAHNSDTAEAKSEPAENGPGEGVTAREVKKAESAERRVKDAAALNGYYFKIRERIKSVLEKNRGAFMGEGEIYVRFTVRKNGALRDVAVYKNSAKETSHLEAVVIKSIKEAAPFPPFSEGIDKNELVFKLPVRSTFQP